MKIKDLIKHLETLDQEKELIIIATDPTGWDYGAVIDENSISEDTIYPCEDNGLIEYFGHEYFEAVDEDEDDSYELNCYVIKVDC
jgi:hypothetical protein